MTPEDTAREAAIWRGFRQAQGHALSRRGRENPPPDTGILFLSIISLLLISFTDPVVWWGLLGGLRSSDFFFPPPPLHLFLASLLLLPLNGWLAQIRLRWWTPQDWKRPPWVRALRFGAACLFPFGGVTFAPVWLELLRRNPTWIRPRGRGGDSARLTLRKPSLELPKRPALEQLHRSQILWLSLIIASGIPFMMGGLIALDPEGIFGWPGAMVFSLGLHVILFLGISHFSRQFSHLLAGSPWIRLLTPGRWLLLFPDPIWVVGLLLIALAPFRPLRGTWIGGLYSPRSDALRLPLWRKTSKAFRPKIRKFSWTDLEGRLPQVGTLPEEGRAAGKREALARLRILFLPLEVGLLTWLIAQGIGWRPLSSTLVTLLTITAGLAFGSVLLQAFPGLAETFRWDRARPLAPYLRNGALLLPAAGCLLGILGGAGSILGDIRIVGMALELLGVFLGLLGVVYLAQGVVRRASHRLDGGLLLTWSFLHGSFPILGALLKASPGLADRAVILALATPILGLVAGLALAPALLRPFTWRHIFDRQLQGGFRTILAAVGLTAVIPLGGLAVPFWIWARQRLWPQYEGRILAHGEERKPTSLNQSSRRSFERPLFGG